jgi:SAM-dependent methyltransferase
MTSPAALARAVAARYRGRGTRGFVKGKLRGDPALAALLALPPLGTVLDLGCGRGQLALALLLAGRAGNVTGLDLDAAKIAQAGSAAEGLAARFLVADLVSADIPGCDTALLIDVLLLMPPAAQRALLGRVIAAGPARIIIRAFDPDRGWRSTIGFVVEHLRRRLGADRAGDGVAPLPLRDLAAPLDAAGFRVSVTPCWGGMPLPNVLILAERP